MHKVATHKELQDPFSHYVRGILTYDEGKFTFVAYRLPYQDLNKMSWETEQDFTNDYRRMVAKKYLV